MAKFHGEIGFAEMAETAPGVHSVVITEHTYTGDVLRDSRSWDKSENLNDNLVINNKITIISDAFLFANFPAIKYVKWQGNAWRISNIEIQRPRVILTIGGIYNVPKN